MIRKHINISSEKGEDLYICRIIDNDELTYHVGESNISEGYKSNINIYNIKSAYRYDVTYSPDLFPELIKTYKYIVTTNDGLIVIGYEDYCILYDLIYSDEENNFNDINPNSELSYDYDKVYELHQEPFPMDMRTIRFDVYDGNFYHKLKVLQIKSNPDRVLVYSDYDFENTDDIKISETLGGNLISDLNWGPDDSVSGYYWVIGTTKTELYIQMNKFKYKPHYCIQLSENNDFSNSSKKVNYIHPSSNIDGYVDIANLLTGISIESNKKVMRVI